MINDYTLSQEATPPGYTNGPYDSGICLNNRAKARNCNVQQFNGGLNVRNGGEVVNSDIRNNYNGIFAVFIEDATLTIEDT
jgi:hypothetical protein